MTKTSTTELPKECINVDDKLLEVYSIYSNEINVRLFILLSVIIDSIKPHI